MSADEFTAAWSTAFDATPVPPDTEDEACAWPINYAACTDCAPLSDLSDTEQAVFEQMAQDFLWQWTGRRFGVCPVTIRPCRQDCWQGVSTFTGGGSLTTDGRLGRPYGPVLLEGRWFNISCGQCGDLCSCTYTPTLHIPGPVQAITEIRIDGEPLDPHAYRVDNRHLLIRTDGGDWPSCQDQSADPETDDNTFQIRYQRGIPVPPGGQIAAGVLACELARAVCRDKDCQLPQRVQSITRQGVTVGVALDAFDDVVMGRTGIWVVDSWLASITKSPATSRVYSPDISRSRPRRTTWTAAGPVTR